LGYGYATTVHKSQGATVDRAFLLGSDALYREAGYVGLSRARQRSDLYLVAATTTASHDRVHVDPIARLAQQLNRSQAQQLATAITILPGDPVVSLADLEAERDRLRRQLGQWPEVPGTDDSHRWYDVAHRQRVDAQQRLDTIGDLPRRQRPHAQAVAQQDLAAATALEQRFAGEVAAQQQLREEWDRWIEANGPIIDRYQQLGTLIAGRHHALGLAALADPAPHHIEALGPPPLTGAPRDRWAQTADAIDTYRQRWQIEGPDPLGPPPMADTEQARHRSLAQRRIDDLNRTLQLDRRLDHGMEL
ncbi:MAG TPA: ATP-binding domain-containing protein, partial [Acidimicrobiales bacterium]|nr:ATP-binding domain-containing protein [Acidimicrobiales bacterium]